MSLVISLLSNSLMRASFAVRRYGIPKMAKITTRWQSNLTFKSHAFSAEYARRILTKQGILAPAHSKVTALAPMAKDPLETLLLPFTGIKTKITKTIYEGKYGIQRTYVTTNSQGKIERHYYYDWYPLKGTLGPCTYCNIIYSGFRYERHVIEKALPDNLNLSSFQPFEHKLIDEGTLVDPFLMHESTARAIEKETIEEKEFQRAEEYAEKDLQESLNLKIICDVRKITRHFKTTITFHLIPFYVLQSNPKIPPRVIAALYSNNTKVVGPAPLSIYKCTTLGVITGAAMAVLVNLINPIPLAIQGSICMLNALGGGIYASKHLKIIYFFQQKRIEKLTHRNQSKPESQEDIMRQTITEKVIPTTIKPSDLHRHYDILGLNPNQKYSQKDIEEAFRQKIKICHPDKGGSEEDAQQLIMSRQILLTKLDKSNILPPHC